MVTKSLYATLDKYNCTLTGSKILTGFGFIFTWWISKLIGRVPICPRRYQVHIYIIYTSPRESRCKFYMAKKNQIKEFYLCFSDITPVCFTYTFATKRFNFTPEYVSLYFVGQTLYCHLDHPLNIGRFIKSTHRTVVPLWTFNAVTLTGFQLVPAQTARLTQVIGVPVFDPPWTAECAVYCA